jgi:ATP adenylyltransferase
VDDPDPPNRRFSQLIMRAMLQGSPERRASSLLRVKRLWAPWRLEYVQHADEGGECIFCRAAALPEDEPELVVHRGELAFVLLNKFPYASGHLMVAPYRHGSAFDDLEDAEALEVQRLSVAAIEALRAVFAPEGFNLGWNLGRVAGAGIVDHGHLHVVPRWNGDTNFMPVLAYIKVIPEHLLETRRKLADAWPLP